MRKEEKCRLEGISFALSYLEKHGNDVDALREEAKRRGAHGIPIGMTQAQYEEIITKISMRNCKVLCTAALAVLIDEFGFGNRPTEEREGRLNRFIVKFNELHEAIGDDYVTWDDWDDLLREKYNIEFEGVDFK